MAPQISQCYGQNYYTFSVAGAVAVKLMPRSWSSPALPLRCRMRDARSSPAGPVSDAREGVAEERDPTPSHLTLLRRCGSVGHGPSASTPMTRVMVEIGSQFSLCRGRKPGGYLAAARRILHNPAQAVQLRALGLLRNVQTKNQVLKYRASDCDAKQTVEQPNGLHTHG